jgi:hypothetical protein
LAASSRGKAIRLVRAKAHEGGAKALPESRGRGRGDRGVRGSISSGRRGKTTPTLEEPRLSQEVVDSRGKAIRVQSVIRRSVRGCREALGPLVSRTEPKTPWGVHAVKVAESAGNARGTGVRSIIQVAEVGQTHRASCPPGGRKACWRARALARRKLEAPPDVGHEPREGETVRGKAFTIKSTCWFGL